MAGCPDLTRRAGRALFPAVIVALGIAGAMAMGLSRLYAASPQTFRTPVAQVENVRFERVGGGVINVLYDLKSDDASATFSIVLEVSQDAGQTFALKPINVSGDVGPSVAPGTGKKIVWEAAKDVDLLLVDQFRFRVTPERGALVATNAVARVGQLTITTDPAGASVAVDGVVRGQTPVTLRDLAVGSHRVTLTKDGFLENAATVDVKEGGAEKLERKLTPGQGATTAAGGGSNKALKIGVPVAAAGALVGILAAKGGSKPTPTPPPTGGTVVVTPAVGLMSATPFAISAQNVTGGAQPLTFSWSLGDGTSASGQSVTHTYNTFGVLGVNVTVADSSQQTLSLHGVVQINTVTGAWKGTYSNNAPFTLNMAQNQGSITNVVYTDFSTFGPRTAVGTGTVTAPGKITVNLQYQTGPGVPTVFSIVLTADADASVTTFNGSVSGFQSPFTFTMTR